MPRRSQPSPPPFRKARYEDNVFVNCPLDESFLPLFRAIVFATYDSGFVARCALEVSDASQNRLEKIMDIVEECKYGIHDLSRTEPGAYGLPRFNMPLELGVFLGAKRYGRGAHARKVCLVLDTTRYRYQRFISDIAGQDIHDHRGSPRRAVCQVRDWLRTSSRRATIPGGDLMWRRYERFRRQLPSICEEAGLDDAALTFVDYTALVEEWLAQNPI